MSDYNSFFQERRLKKLQVVDIDYIMYPKLRWKVPAIIILANLL